MSLFNKKVKTDNSSNNKITNKEKSPENDKKNKSFYFTKNEEKDMPKLNEDTNVKIKKKTKIGLRQKNKKPKKTTTKETHITEETTIKNDDKADLIEEVMTIEEDIENKEGKKPYTSKKKKTIIKKDMKGKPVFLEDTGEKLGTIFDTIYDKDNSIIGYKIKDGKTEAVLSFPSDQFEDHKEGLIFVPGWFTNASKIIEKLEFKDKISPELTALLSDDTVSNEELYNIFVKHDDEMAEYIDDAKSLREMLTSRLRVLEKQRIALKDDLMDLTEKRLIKDIDRRQFSEDVLSHRRKVNVLDLNIAKCKDLIKRLDKTSFGTLGKNNLLFDPDSYVKETKLEGNLYNKILDSKNKLKQVEREEKMSKDTNAYKEKYLSLKVEYEQLEEDYQELKIAVDKLVSKDD